MESIYDRYYTFTHMLQLYGFRWSRSPMKEGEGMCKESFPFPGWIFNGWAPSLHFSLGLTFESARERANNQHLYFFHLNWRNTWKVSVDTQYWLVKEMYLHLFNKGGFVVIFSFLDLCRIFSQPYTIIFPLRHSTSNCMAITECKVYFKL